MSDPRRDAADAARHGVVALGAAIAVGAVAAVVLLARFGRR
jgi:hypothetical protein